MEIPYTVQAREDTGLYNAKVGIWLFLASEVMLFGALFSSYILLRVGALPGTWPHGLLNIPIGTFNTAVLISSSVTVVLSWAALKTGNIGRFKLYMGLTLVCALGFLGIKSIEYRDKFTHYEVWKTDGTRLTGHLEGNPWFWSTKTLQQKSIKEIEFVPDGWHYTMSTHEIAEAKKEHHGHGEPVKIPVTEIKRLSAFVPAHSTYFAVYFTLTFLHAMHVLGGAIVLGYFWVTGGRMFKTEPDRLTNRVEVGGLFWHFVDLVWIFLFPVLYLL